jgi:hypothetical protein
MKRIAVVVVLGLMGCGKKKEDAGGSAPAPAGSATAGSGSAEAAGSGSAATAPVDAAVAAEAPDAPAAVAKVCCCESSGDATHYTIEGDPSACTADDMRGTCVDLKECELESEPRVMVVGTATTVEPAGLLAIWPTKEKTAFAAVEIKPAGAKATVRTNGGNDPVPWKKQGTIETQPGPLTVTPQADGTAIVTNGKTTWVLEQENRYGKVTFKKHK